MMRMNRLGPLLAACCNKFREQKCLFDDNKQTISCAVKMRGHFQPTMPVSQSMHISVIILAYSAMLNLPLERSESEMLGKYSSRISIAYVQHHHTPKSSPALIFECFNHLGLILLS